MHKVIEDLNWRYATKKFDTTKKISPSNLKVIKESLRLTPSSYGLQPLHYIIIEDDKIRQELTSASFGQMQVTEASHLIVICAYTEINDEHVDSYIENVISIRKTNPEQAKKYGGFLKKTFSEMSNNDQLTWSSKQAYIALGQLLHTCANLRIDATPMEGFIASRYSEILNLSDRNLKPILICPVGYRHTDDIAQHENKVRKDIDFIFETI